VNPEKIEQGSCGVAGCLHRENPPPLLPGRERGRGSFLMGKIELAAVASLSKSGASARGPWGHNPPEPPYLPGSPTVRFPLPTIQLFFCLARPEYECSSIRFLLVPAASG